jgi:hypothetical protein
MMAATWLRVVRVGLALGVVLAVAAIFGAARPAAAQGEVSIYFVAFACPETAENPYVNCDILDGATYSIEADGVALAGSPFTTAPTSLVPGFNFDAPEDATLTITQLSGNPSGYVPAAGYDPYVVAVADLPEVGCGGESTCPGVEFFNVPSEDFEEAPASGGDETSEVASLPNTGVGVMPASASDTSLLLVAGLAAMMGLGVAVSRRLESR